MKASLVRLTYEHARSKDTFLQHFFYFVDDDDTQGHQPTFEHGLSKFLGFTSQIEPLLLKEAEGAIDAFAEYLFQNFFLPMKAAGSKTPQPSVASSSAPGLENVVGTPARLSTLRRDCLIRDHNRCVVTQAFNLPEAVMRRAKDPNPKDDDDELLVFKLGDLADLEVAHIIPHSIMSAKTVDGEMQLSESKKTALAILNMFDPGVVHLIEGPNIDRPFNAISLTREAHTRFGLFQISFEPLNPADANSDTNIPKHTYRIHGTPIYSDIFNLPVTRTLLISPHHTIDPPSSKLLSLHRAIAMILELSAAGEYIEHIIQHIEEVWVRSDGSVELGHIVALRMGGWLDVAA
ncbi:hypothetical protein FQN53_009095 [Emmonsiellopsis sp. PD_33]|nr:hypothetical protein FQN53_009095 [Emmonsiellopsis sp. PD_33]